MWNLRYGETDRYGRNKAQLIASAALEKGDPVPERVIPPPLYDSNNFYWMAFHDLITCRPMGFGGPLPIPWTVLNEYAERYGLEGFFYDEFIYIIKELDIFHLKWIEKQNAKDK